MRAGISSVSHHIVSAPRSTETNLNESVVEPSLQRKSEKWLVGLGNRLLFIDNSHTT